MLRSILFCVAVAGLTSTADARPRIFFWVQPPPETVVVESYQLAPAAPTQMTYYSYSAPVQITRSVNVMQVPSRPVRVQLVWTRRGWRVDD